jgi:RNA polymerase sigma factor (sigma-70 family)
MVTEDREMLEPPQRRKPATELEVKLARGDPTVREALIEMLDGVLHEDLKHLYPTRLPDDERATIVVGVIADFIDGTVTYDHRRASIETLAKRRARQRAIDYLRHVKVRAKNQRNDAQRSAISLIVDVPGGNAERADLIERLIVMIEELPQNQRRAALAYMRHGDADPKCGGKAYSTILAEQLGVSPNQVARWWCEAKKSLKAALDAPEAASAKRSKA